MGRIHFAGTDILDSLIEIVGYKCGVAIDRARLREILHRLGEEEFATINESSYLRLESTVYEHLVHDLLGAFGRTEGDFNPHPHITLFHKYKKDDRLADIYNDCLDLTNRWFKKIIKSGQAVPKTGLDPSSLMEKVMNKHGPEGGTMLLEILGGFNSQVLSSPWSAARQVEWENPIELRDLFESEGLHAAYGQFIDQRFIDFLHRNFSDIDRMHWRKFEQLTAEYLDREGYVVKLGPGRGDDGVDVRAWAKGSENQSPLIIAQCKRQKAAVDKVIVKALYADVLEESATSGLLVTTSRLAPGANDTRIARAYPIEVADRRTMAEWLRQMREPGVGGDLFSN